MRIRKVPYTLQFNVPAGTSRGVLHEKPTWFIHYESEGIHLFGECGLLPGLSLDDRPGYEDELDKSIEAFMSGTFVLEDYNNWPSIQCGWDMLLRKIESQDDRFLWNSSFTDGAPLNINGLVWMGKADFMKRQIRERIEAGFTCVKMKVGAIDFESELELLRGIRREFNRTEIELRVDANGAFSPDSALNKMKRLADLEIHSIEQPIAAGQWIEMAELCRTSPLPIALDEELIPLTDPERKKEMMNTIKPAYIILKPSLIGGFQRADDWIELAERAECAWWATSALESNIGLNAIAQWVSTKNNPMPQGLGTGSLYTNNIPSPLNVSNGHLSYDRDMTWNLQPLIDA